MKKLILSLAVLCSVALFACKEEKKAPKDSDTTSLKATDTTKLQDVEQDFEDDPSFSGEDDSANIDGLKDIVEDLDIEIDD